jgi:hypothetical protein
MSLFPDETWRGFVEKLPTDEDKVVLTKLLDCCYKYSLAMNEHTQEHPFPSETLIITLLLTQHKLIIQLKSMMQSRNK